MPQPTKRLLLNPLEALLLTRERIQEVLDDAVARGRMTRDDASELLAELVRRGRRSTDDLVDGLASLPPDRVMREVDRARRAAGLGSSFPITGYDELTAAKVIDHLEGLSPAELRAVRDHERRNANRKSVLSAIERRLP
ncbi:MAG TPA: hypothetical protein VFP78_20665 [Solirubrobacteraceae bacterium]|nr:hypothetical protein [Solirubrobacteraceae bacterium]